MTYSDVVAGVYLLFALARHTALYWGEGAEAVALAEARIRARGDGNLAFGRRFMLGVL